MAGSFTNLIYHIIFSTKNRKGLIDDSFSQELYKYIGGIIRGEGGVLLGIGGTANHVHVVAKVKPVTSISDLIRKVKSKSSKWLHENPKCRVPFKWQNGYGAFSVSESRFSDVKQYVKNQFEHHRERTFKEEFLTFLHKHNIDYDERYIWE